jgi:rRNA pseudouridine-1189 N-methylase Emg1 (Nep1/Mra1 family)
MSELAYTRFMASYMLNDEERLPENKDEIIAYTEDVLQARGIECDKRISEMPDEQIREILEEVRKLRKNKKKSGGNNSEDKTDEDKEKEGVEVAASS